MNKAIGKDQTGFREGRLTVDTIHVLDQTIEKC